jgi:hypothetical protein
MMTWPLKVMVGVGVPPVTVKLSPGAVSVSAVHVSVPVPGVPVAVQFTPLTVIEAVLLDEHEGEMQALVLESLRVVVQVSVPEVLTPVARGLGTTAMLTGVGGAPAASAGPTVVGIKLAST